MYFPMLIVFLHAFLLKGVHMAITISAYDGTGIPQQQALTMFCNYTKLPTDLVMGFYWLHNDSLIASGTVSSKITLFQSTSLWSSGVFLGDYTSTLTIQLPAAHVVPSVVGEYTCRISALRERAEATAIATINQTPQLPGFPSRYTQIELSDLYMDCSDYVSPNTPAAFSFQWMNGGVKVSQTSVLSIAGIKRSDAGLYTCSVRSSLGQVSKTLYLDVLYKPYISGQDPLYPALELSSLKIDCTSYTVPGNPKDTRFIWTGPNNLYSAGSVLPFSNISRVQAGRYFCTASNTLTPAVGSAQTGTDIGQFNIDVFYLDTPSMTSSTDTDLMEGDNVTIACSVDSNPPAHASIKHGSSNILVYEYTNTVQYTWTNIKCRDNGIYTCSVMNGRTRTRASVHKKLNVLCPPQRDESRNLTSPVYAERGKVVSLHAYVLANPKPVCRWYRRFNDNGKLDDIPSSVEHNVTSLGQRSTLKIIPRNADDYGIYVMVATNEYGSFRTDVNLASTGEWLPFAEGKDVWGEVPIAVVIVLCLVVLLLLVLLCCIYMRRHGGYGISKKHLQEKEYSAKSEIVDPDDNKIRL